VAAHNANFVILGFVVLTQYSSVTNTHRPLSTIAKTRDCVYMLSSEKREIVAPHSE